MQPVWYVPFQILSNLNFMPSNGLLSCPFSVHKVALTENCWTATMGSVEKTNQTLKTLLRIQMKQIPEDMCNEELPLLILAYHSSVQESTQFTPYQLMFGREVQLPIELMLDRRPTSGETHGNYITHLHERVEAVYGVVHEDLRHAAPHQKQCYDRKITGGRYKVGNTVWLYFYSPAVSKRRAPKFHRPRKGPYQVVKVLSDVTYCIHLVPPRNKHDR